ncbi:PREDICTED: transcription factor MYB59-like isoform X2 [Nelumbo nucifera]|uniref:Transcription factor MYB59-like isoform X2 n=1 Tax=Nelumbo nucifera TaxID=4432 RepID=A0A1U8A1J9_NELNU|nr:PREDICTED: transcription factor MYB59-like isoform X2 [Nelumbo nucifera]
MKMVQEEIRKGPWTEQEDLQLVCFVGLFGERRWDFIAKVSGLNRTGKSCRLRWVNYLHPGLKRGRMTPQEEQLVLELHSRWGNRWSRIARKLPGRTDNEIKNYWRTHMRKKAQERKRSISPSSSSSQCSSPSTNNPPAASSISLPETHNGEGISSLHNCGSSTDLSAVRGEVSEEADAIWYPMDDQIWKEFPSVEEAISGPVYEGRKDEGCSSYPPMASPLWDYCCSDTLWRMDEEEIKMILPMADHFVSTYGHDTRE